MPGEVAPVAEGEKVFKKCRSCHQVGDGARHRTGPILNGMVGRTMGSVDDFKKYSKRLVEMGSEGMVWDEAALHEFLTKPKKYMPGTKMSFAGVRKPADMENLLAYLKSFSGSN